MSGPSRCRVAGLSVLPGTLVRVRTLTDLLVPSRCAGCGRDGPVLCGACEALLGAPLRVRLARVPPPVFALGRYNGPVRAALIGYKERGRRELARPLGRALAAGVHWLGGAPELGPAAPDGLVWLVPVPSRRAAARRRGGDHVRRIADAAAAALAAAGVPAAVAPALRLASGTRDSVGLDAAARSANLAGRIRIRSGGLPPPATPVVLVDDVATTGATAAGCTAALSTAGISVRAVLVVASAASLRHSSDLRDHSVTARDNVRTVERRST